MERRDLRPQSPRCRSILLTRPAGPARAARRVLVLLAAAVLVACLLGPLTPAAHARDAGVQTVPVFSTDFESGLPVEFTAPGSVIEGVQGYAGLGTAGNQFGGNFLRYTATTLYDTRLVLRNLPAHDQLDLGFLLAVIDSWDGTELMQVLVDGNLLFSHWFQLATGDTSDYFPPPGGLLSAHHNLGFSNGGYYYRDRAYDLSIEPVFNGIPHTADSVTVTWRISAVSGPAAAQWQGGADESWAIENVSVQAVRTAGVGPGSGGPALSLAGARPNPGRADRLAVGFALASDAPASLELFDIAGRRVAWRDVGSLGAGPHVVDLAAGGKLAAGVFFVRLRQGADVRIARTAVMK